MTRSRHSPDRFQLLEAIRLRSTVISFGLPSGPGIFMWPVRSVTKYRPSMIGLATEGPDYLVGGAFGAIDFARDDAGERINVMVST